MHLYIDSSAFAKYYGEPEFEKGTNQVDKIIEQVKQGKHILFSSYWLVPEVASTIDSWARKKYISAQQKKLLHTRLISDVLDWLQSGQLALLGIKYAVYLEADFLKFVMIEGLSSGDALHVYTATIVQPDYFITADKKQSKVAKSLNITSYNPEKEVWK